ncbi:MAG TPA: vitamin K epoxide reductase family protein [Parafilimonas sp.]|nr:vitamin K epoxide reductase family protein [Parafilimonas sp.]
MLQLFNPNEQIVAVTIRLLKALNVKVAGHTVSEAILNHPDYPSILSISDALNKWHVHNAAIKIKVKDLKNIILPCIAFIKQDSGSFVLLKAVNDDAVLYSDGTGKTIKQSIIEFEKAFSGIVLLAEVDEGAGEKNYLASRRKEIKKQVSILLCFVAFAILLVISIFQFAGNNAPLSFIFPGLSIFNFTGLCISIILLRYEVDKTNPTLQKICTGGHKTNCNAVLSSKAAKVAGVSWSELGFVYFAGLYVLLLLTGLTNNAALLQVAITFNLLAFLYVPFSIFYQWKIIKQWCPLCLTVQAVLLISFAVSVMPGVNNGSLIAGAFFNNRNLSILLFAFTLPAVALLITKPLLLAKQKADEDFRALQRIKFNTDIFNALLEKQKRVSESADGLGILLGNKNATNTLIKVCNPYCGPCAKAHPEIENLLEENENLKVQIIFTAANTENDIKAPPVKHLLAIAENSNEMVIKAALDDWYMADKKDYLAFAAKYPMNGEQKLQDKKIENMRKWCEQVDISFTPTIFFNSYQLPDAYSIGDLKYFLAV